MKHGNTINRTQHKKLKHNNIREMCDASNDATATHNTEYVEREVKNSSSTVSTLIESLPSAITYDESSTMVAIRRIHTSITEFIIRTHEPLTSSDLSNVYNDSISVGKSVARLSISLLVPAIKFIRGLGTGIAKATQVPPIDPHQPNNFG